MDHSDGKTLPLNEIRPSDDTRNPRGSTSPLAHAAPETVGVTGEVGTVPGKSPVTVDEIEESGKGRFAYFRTRNFYVVLGLGYVDFPPCRPSLTRAPGAQFDSLLVPFFLFFFFAQHSERGTGNNS